MKRVLLLGDSIREHCQTVVQKMLGEDMRFISLGKTDDFRLLR